MKLFIIIVVTSLTISRVFDKTLVTTEARNLRKMDRHEHFNVNEDFVEAKMLKKIDNKNNLNNRFTNDFAPTNPRHNPGIGHPRVINNRFTKDFAPTNPGHSHGIGHLRVVNNKFTNDFAPTNPGNSPDIGHP
ncbi:Precursor of CEP10 [Arabidopsis thaliana]